ncbi:MAG TPA: alginate export family protein [Longimicrobiales bacterium]|nr:alginate export family protein [Longimicrobiales bacterium]
MTRSLSFYIYAALLMSAAPLPVLAQAGDIRVLGEVRVRAEAEEPAAIDTGNVFSLLRARLGIEAVLAPRALLFVQVQDARTWGEEATTTDGSADQLDVHQAWLQYGSTVGDWEWAVRAGRQEINLGNERLVGAVGWSNTGRAFDAARLTLGPERASWNVSALAAIVQERGLRLTGTAGEDHLLLGAFVDAAPVELFALHDSDAAFRLWSDVDRTTAGARIVSPAAAALTASIEGAYQFGSQTGLFDDIIMPQDISAWLLAGRIGYATPFSILPRLGVGIDVLSGDDSPTDSEYGAFNTLYATNHKFYGYIDFFLDPAARTLDRGLIDGMASASVGLPGGLNLNLDGHAFWLHEELPVEIDRLIGWELDVTVPVQLGAGQQLQLGYSAFRNGPGGEFIGLGREREWSHWGYVQATFSFGGGAAPLR